MSTSSNSSKSRASWGSIRANSSQNFSTNRANRKGQALEGGHRLPGRHQGFYRRVLAARFRTGCDYAANRVTPRFAFIAAHWLIDPQHRSTHMTLGKVR